MQGGKELILRVGNGQKMMSRSLYPEDIVDVAMPQRDLVDLGVGRGRGVVRHAPAAVDKLDLARADQPLRRRLRVGILLAPPPEKHREVFEDRSLLHGRPGFNL